MDISELFGQWNIKVKNPKLIQTAFVHSSYVNENRTLVEENNERLEFLGDAVLQLWITAYLYRLEDKMSEGNMTMLRAQLVCESSLAQYARDLQLGEYLLLGIGEEKNNGRNRDSILADCFEAFLGAIYFDSGYEVVEKLLNEVIVPYIEKPKTEAVIDYKTMLQEYIQADTRQAVKYEVVHTDGPSNAPIFHVVVKLDNIILGEGYGTSKKRAEQKAAQNACYKLAV